MYSIPDKLPAKQTNASDTLYETSNMRDYKGLPGSPARNGRPGTSNFCSDTKTGQTQYNEEFEGKSIDRDDPMKSGSSSGQRKNNPHPLETFMVWKFPDKMQLSDGMMKESLLKELCEDKIRSTYQVDYMGLKQGEPTQFRRPEQFAEYIQKHCPPKTLCSTGRVDYQTPETHIEELQGNTTRFGCNAKKEIPAVGVVPTVVHRSPQMKPTYDTSYTDEFAKRQDDYVNDCVREYPDISKHFKKMTVKERKVIEGMLSAIKAGESPDDPQDRFGMIERISGWDGPSWK